MVYLQATANAKSSSARLLDLVDLGQVTLYVSRETLREVRQTLDDPGIRARLIGITDLVIEALFRRADGIV
jgi:predicted nucleic acid-binding protein